MRFVHSLRILSLTLCLFVLVAPALVSCEDLADETTTSATITTSTTAPGEATTTTAESPTGTTFGGPSPIETVEVPTIGFVTEAQGISMLSAVGLVAEVTYMPAYPMEDGMVIMQDPEPGTIVAVGSTVHLTVGVWEEPETVAVPTIGFVTEAQGTSMLSAVGLVADVTYMPAYPMEDGMVIMQDPEPGTIVAVGSTVHLTVGVWE